MGDGTREQLFLVTFVVAGNDLGVWDKVDGIAIDTDSSKYRSGGQPEEEDLGGAKTYPDVTVSRNYQLARDGIVEPWLIAQCKLDAGVVITRQPLNRSYQPQGPSVTAIGVLKTVTPSGSDSMSNNPAMLACVCGVNSIT